jgi:molecular chaperone DnaK (HSP70)
VGDIQIINQWPTSSGKGKIPSAIAYPEDNPYDNMSGVRWGSDTKGLHSYLWTKLLLGKDSRSDDLDITRLRQLLGKGFVTLPQGKGAKDVVTDYLRELYKWLVVRLTVQNEVLFRVSPLEIWVTVPAMWTDAAKNATREAVLAAGFGSRPSDTVNIITEPEAAALTVMTKRDGLGAISGLEVSSPNVRVIKC